MKKLRFKRLSLMSQLEKAAQSLQFHPTLTVIMGKNDSGKSSLLKSIYWILGTEPAVVPDNWKAAHVVGMLDITIDGTPYTVVRSAASIAVFAENGRMIFDGASITQEFGPFLSRLLDFKLMLTDIKRVPSVPPPAFCFLPFYIDQDLGWLQPLKSFANLGQYPNYAPDVLHYHSGMRPNEYYIAKTELKSVETQKTLVEGERVVVEIAANKIKDITEFSGLQFTLEQFENEVSSILRELKTLREDRQRRAKKMALLLEEKLTLEHQVSIAKEAIKEFSNDVIWTRAIELDYILCPTCGVEHRNSFANKFSILNSQQECIAFVNDCMDRLARLSKRIEGTRDSIRSSDTALDRIEADLSVRRGEVALRDVLRAEGKRQARAILDEQLDEKVLELARIENDIKELRRGLRAIEDPKRKKAIEESYFMAMSKHLQELNVHTLPRSSVQKIDSKISDTGSDQPRAILAYFLAVYNTVRNNTTSVIAPMVIDSPIQQDQDRENSIAMLTLLTSERWQEDQMILGTVSMHGVATGTGSIVVLDRKYQVLDSDQYDDVRKDMAPFLDQMR